MSQSADLQKLEQRAYLSYHQDGLLDLIIGTAILALGLNEAMDTTIWSLVAIMLIIAYVPLKKRITFSRIGYVEFNVKRKGLDMRVVSAVVIMVLVLLLVGMIVVLLSSSTSSSALLLEIRESPLMLYALIGFIGFGLAGLISGIRRLYIYALLSVVITLSAHLLNLPISVPFLVLSGTILTIGAIFLVRFLRRYPIALEENHVD
jgi:uncharacterized membrane protein